MLLPRKVEKFNYFHVSGDAKVYLNAFKVIKESSSHFVTFRKCKKSQ